MPINKGEVSCSHWSYKIKFICAHYSGGVLKGGIIRSLKSAAADKVWLVGLQTTMTDVLSKLDDVYGTVARLNALMQSFYHIQQGRSKMVSAFIMRLEDIPSDNQVIIKLWSKRLSTTSVITY